VRSLNIILRATFTVLSTCSCLAETNVDKREFLVGGDISMLTRIEELGGVFRENGKPGGFLAILKKHRCNCHRLRIFVNPTYNNAVVQDVPYTIALAKRIKAHGAKLLLNFHYSDTWADPGHQRKPAAWQDLDFDALQKKVRDYTASVIAAFKEEGVLPDMVQVGNEITPGMLWPDGRIGHDAADEQWDRFVRLLKAGVEGVKEPLGRTPNIRIMIHIDRGGDWKTTKWFFDNIIKRGVEFDIIGQSYYPWWHGTMDDLRLNLQETARTYGKDIMVVETAYPHHSDSTLRTGEWSPDRMAWSVSPKGQHAFLAELIKTVRHTPNKCGLGVLWWYPESIPTKGLRIWCQGAMALFDEGGNALPAVKAFEATSDRDGCGSNGES